MGDQVLGEVANSIAIAEMHLRRAARRLNNRRDPEAAELVRLYTELRALHVRLFSRSIDQRYKSDR